jgi:hypothetical protein
MNTFEIRGNKNIESFPKKMSLGKNTGTRVVHYTCDSDHKNARVYIIIRFRWSRRYNLNRWAPTRGVLSHYS